MLQERLQFHHERLAEHVTAYNGFGFGTSPSGIDAIVQTQASVLSYLDAFWLPGVIALFLPRMPKGAAPAH